MSDMDDEDYGDIADEDLIEAFSQPSQTLPPLCLSPRPAKRRRIDDTSDNDDGLRRGRRKSRGESGSDGSEDDGEEENGRFKKSKYRIHIGNQDVPAAKIMGATQADALPDSSPYLIRGPIYKKPRPQPEPVTHPLFSSSARNAAPKSNPFQGRSSNNSSGGNIHPELEGIPSDAFSSPEKDNPPNEPIFIDLSPLQDIQSTNRPQQRLAAPQQGLRQTTLFGGRAAQVEVSASQVNKVRNFIVDLPPELPTHHVLDEEALKTWVYPTNLGETREYQYNIVKNGLFNNLLVALPTGLGKTFIAATIMFNYYRWTKTAQIVFVAPTKPLVAQQVDACFNIVGIPKSQTTMLTGEQPPALRAEEWEARRVFFMTPQTLDNDLASGIADPKKIVLLVVDEAHRATGHYAYVRVVSFLRRFNKSFRVLALTATPGASVEAVQDVIDNLEISKVEIRTEESMDIQPFVHRRDVDQILLDPSDEIVMVKELLSKTLQPLVNQLCAQNAFYNKDPMSLTQYGLLQARKKWFMSDAAKRANPGFKGMMNTLFSVLTSVSHGIKLLNFHGISPFYSIMKDFREGVEDGTKPSKYKSQIINNPDFTKMMDRIRLWLSKDDFVGHPKMTYLCDAILNHFLDAGEGRLGDDAPPSSTRVIVFSEYRDSAEDIVRVLNRHGPMIRASVFVGQQDSKRSEGMNQAKQQQTLREFKMGKFNVLVATSIGEEGLDIGQVNLIVCYDASASPIRMLQRMGRTGRKRAGNIVLLLMRGKEERAFAEAKDNYEKMQQMITSGSRFNFRHDLSVRIIPRTVTPVVDKRIVEIPVENTQDPSLPEPKRRVARGKKKPPKKFHMPDGVTTGFQQASKLSKDGVPLVDQGIVIKPKKVIQDQLAPIPSIESVLLSSADTMELERVYQNVAGNEVKEVTIPDMTAYPVAQRSLGPTVHVSHGFYTKRCVKLFNSLANSQCLADRFLKPFGDKEPSREFWNPPELVDDENDLPKLSSLTKKAVEAKAKRQPKPKPALVFSDIESDGEDSGLLLSGDRENLASSITGVDSEGEGDDLLDSEVPSEDSDSDDGESLHDFINDDKEHLDSSRALDLVRSSTSPPPAKLKARLFVRSAQLSATQDSNDDDDDDLPNLSQLIGTARTRSTPDEDDKEDERPAPRNRTRRRRLLDEDSDE